MGAIVKFLMFYFLIGFILSIPPIIFRKVKGKDIIEWMGYCTLFYPIYIFAFLMKGLAIFYEKYIEGKFK
jgi:hypothetical protein